MAIEDYLKTEGRDEWLSGKKKSTKKKLEQERNRRRRKSRVKR